MFLHIQGMGDQTKTSDYHPICSAYLIRETQLIYSKQINYLMQQGSYLHSYPGYVTTYYLLTPE